MQIRLALLAGVIALVLLGICLVYADQIITPEGVHVDQIRNADGSVTFTVRTATYNGPYAPRNAGAIWITNGSNQFVKTIKVWASNYRYTLVRWIASSNYNTTGAVTSASLNNHQLHTVTWNAKNAAGVLQDDGNYTFNVEFTEHNATSSNMGKYKTVTFSKSVTHVDQTYPNETFFRDMHLTWTPIVQNGTISGTVLGTNNAPLNGAVIMAGTQTVFSGANGAYTMSLTPGTYDVSCMFDGYETQTQYGVVVASSNTSTLNFNLTAVANDDPAVSGAELVLAQNYPNPFKGATTLRYYLPKAAPAAVSIFNIRGQKVAELASPAKAQGWNEAVWDGKDFNGKPVSTGKYLCVLFYGDETLYRPMTVIK